MSTRNTTLAAIAAAGIFLGAAPLAGAQETTPPEPTEEAEPPTTRAERRAFRESLATMTEEERETAIAERIAEMINSVEQRIDTGDLNDEQLARAESRLGRLQARANGEETDRNGKPSRPRR